MKLGERIAEKRKAQGLTQAELAAVLDVSCDYLLKDDDGLQGEAPSKGLRKYKRKPGASWEKLRVL